MGAGSEWSQPQLFEPVSARRSASRQGSRRTDPREFGGWTLDKLTILEKYLKMYRRVAGSGTFIDAFAGEGAAVINGEVVPGSSVLALESAAFKQLLLIERNRRLAGSLRTRLQGHRWADRCSVLEADCNLEIARLIESETIDRSRPCFAFLDPNSTQLDWRTVERLAEYKTLSADQSECKVELWILFNDRQAIQRLWSVDKTHLPRHANVLDRVMGERSAWIDLWHEGRGPQWLVGRYSDRLLALGYRHVHLQEILDPSTRRRQYWMVHATDHDAAVKFMRWAKRTSSVVFRDEPFPGFG